MNHDGQIGRRQAAVTSGDDLGWSVGEPWPTDPIPPEPPACRFRSDMHTHWPPRLCPVMGAYRLLRAAYRSTILRIA
jgi:hypothetical protein